MKQLRFNIYNYPLYNQEFSFEDVKLWCGNPHKMHHMHIHATFNARTYINTGVAACNIYLSIHWQQAQQNYDQITCFVIHRKNHMQQ